MMDQCSAIHSSLATILQTIFMPNQLVMTNLTEEIESREYSACFFKLNERHIKFRVAHITPTKVGQFVTLWKRDATGGPIKPYDSTDDIDFVIINVQHNDHQGQFVFPKEVLIKQGVLSKNGSGGKRAFRIYPPWDIADNAQAKKSQAWQLNHFLAMPSHAAIDQERVKKLYHLEK